MKRIVLGIVLGASAIGGCAAQSQSSPPPAKEPVMTCNRDAGQAFIGKKATPEIGAELLKATGARTLRWVPPHTMVTMDYRADRLTVSYDEDMVITQVSCT